eukprot:SM000269S09911  [mRNA]  locus=s269:137920:140796:- [translate_table: standard]
MAASPSAVPRERLAPLLAALRADGGGLCAARLEAAVAAFPASAAAAEAAAAVEEACRWLCEQARDLAWEQLHTGPWKDVPVAWRDAYALAGWGLAALALRAGRPAEALRSLDLAVLMGGPLFRAGLDAAISAAQQALSAASSAAAVDGCVSEERRGSAKAEPDNSEPPNGTGGGHMRRAERPSAELAEGRKRAHEGSAEGRWHEEAKRRRQQSIALPDDKLLRSILPKGSLDSSMAVPRVELPALEDFLCSFLLPGVPVIVTGALAHWPALSRWRDLNYLREVAGLRTIPVEVGEHYLADSWRQDLMTLNSFISCHLEDRHAPLPTSDARGYLAQHGLFDQVPQLRHDFSVPEYCMLGGSGAEPVVNAWLGPAGTVTPLHHDPHHNLLAQVVGQKYVRLYDRACADALYPHSETMLHNSSQVDLDATDNSRWPLFAAASYVDCCLAEGEMLYIPPQWWHYVRSLTLSFSVSFWWS